VSFSGREVFDRFKESLRCLIEHVEEEERAKKYLCEMREFILDTKKAREISENKEEFKKRSRELVSRGREIVEEIKYRDVLKDFFDHTKELFDNIRNDEFVTVLRHYAGLVAEDLSYTDTEGRTQIDMEAIGKLRNVIGPVLAESFKYIPIPRIERSDEYREYWVDNIVVCGYDVLPDNIRFQIENDSEVSLRDIEMSRSNTRLIITLKNIRTELKNLEFYYERKSFPALADGGRATLRLSGDGAALTLIFRIIQNPEDKGPRLGEGEVHFNIHQLDILYDSGSLRHSVLIPFMTNMWKQQIRLEIEKEVEKSILNLMKPIGEQLSNTLGQINRPILEGVSKVRGVIKGSEMGKVYEMRREKLE